LNSSPNDEKGRAKKTLKTAREIKTLRLLKALFKFLPC